MASNTRPQFKHPIPRKSSDVPADGEILPVSADTVLSVADIDDAIVEIAWHGISIVVRKMIELDDIPGFVASVLDVCWLGEYYAKEMVDFVFRCTVIAMYSNIKLPEDSRVNYKLVYGTDLYKTISNCANSDQINALRCAIEMYINNTQ